MPSAWLIAHWVWTYGGELAAAVCCALALWRGGRAEKYGAIILLVGWALSLVAIRLHMDALHGVHYTLFAIDGLALIAFTALSLWARKLWTLMISAFQLNDVATHFAAFAPGMDTFTYLTLVGFWGGWAIIFALAWGVWDHERRTRSGLSASR